MFFKLLYYRLLLEEKTKQNNIKPKKNWKIKFNFFNSKKNKQKNNKKQLKIKQKNNSINQNDILNQNISIEGLDKNNETKKQIQKTNFFKKIFLSKIGIFIIIILIMFLFKSFYFNNISHQKSIQRKPIQQLKEIHYKKISSTKFQSTKTKVLKNNSTLNSNNQTSFFFKKRCADIINHSKFAIGLMKNIYINDNIYHIGDKILLPFLNNNPIVIKGYKYINPTTIMLELKVSKNKICNVPINTLNNFNYKIYFYAIKLTDKKTNQSVLLAPQQTAFLKTVFVTTKGNKEAIFNTPKGQFILKENSK